MTPAQAYLWRTLPGRYQGPEMCQCGSRLAGSGDVQESPEGVRLHSWCVRMKLLKPTVQA